MLTIIYILLGTILTDSTPSYEQLTADYFFGTIWKEKYQDYKSIEFANETDTTVHVGHVYGCPDWSEKEKKEVKDGRTIKQIKLNGQISVNSVLMDSHTGQKTGNQSPETQRSADRSIHSPPNYPPNSKH